MEANLLGVLGVEHGMTDADNGQLDIEATGPLGRGCLGARQVRSQQVNHEITKGGKVKTEAAAFALSLFRGFVILWR